MSKRGCNRPLVLDRRCPECGCYHFGTNGCVYRDILSDLASTPEQKANAADMIRLHKEGKAG